VRTLKWITGTSEQKILIQGQTVWGDGLKRPADDILSSEMKPEKRRLRDHNAFQTKQSLK